jgi:putative transcriptional regulator
MNGRSKVEAKGRIANKVSELMGARRMKITELSEQTGLSYAAARAIYHGDTQSIEFNVLAKLCEVFDCQVGDILEYAPEE